MRLADITIGMLVRVKSGYSVRPAVVTGILSNGRVDVRFTDITHEEARTISRYQRWNLFGAVVRPNQIQEEP